MIAFPTPDPLLFIVAVLVTYRLARLVTLEDGPRDVFLRIRIRLGAYDYQENSTVARTNAGRMVTCPFCIGMWIALALAPVLFGVNTSTILVWLAVAGGQSFLETLGR